MFTTATNIQNSILMQTGTAAINVRGTLNLPASGTTTATVGKNSQPLDQTASAFNSGTSKAVSQLFQWKAEPASNNTSAPSGTLNLLFGSGAAAPSETGLRINSKGQFTFASGQTYPGTITNVKAGTDLLGGGTSGIVTLNLDTTKVPQLATANSFTGNQKVSGTLSATSSAGTGVAGTSGSGSGVTGTSTSARCARNKFKQRWNLWNQRLLRGGVWSKHVLLWSLRRQFEQLWDGGSVWLRQRHVCPRCKYRNFGSEHIALR